jgi:hypothetical protein
MTRYAANSLSRRRFIEAASLFGILPFSAPAWADAFVNLDLPGGAGSAQHHDRLPAKGSDDSAA